MGAETAGERRNARGDIDNFSLSHVLSSFDSLGVRSSARVGAACGMHEELAVPLFRIAEDLRRRGRGRGTDALTPDPE